MKRSDYYNLTQMKERGWTASIVKKLVDIQPTEFKGMYSRQPQKCYPKEYVENLEKTDQFVELRKKATSRQVTMKAVAESKREANIAKFSAKVDAVKVPELSADELKARTIKSKRKWYSYQADMRGECDEGIDVAHLPNDVLYRWEVNYIRHELTRYETLLDQIYGIVGAHDSYLVIKNQILDKIASVYPWLKDECERQKQVV